MWQFVTALAIFGSPWQQFFAPNGQKIRPLFWQFLEIQNFDFCLYKKDIFAQDLSILAFKMASDMAIWIL